MPASAPGTRPAPAARKRTGHPGLRVGCSVPGVRGRFLPVDTVLTLLAAAGVLTTAWQLLRAAVGFLAFAATRIWAGEMAETHARHGDLTALQEDRQEQAAAARSGTRSGLTALVWLALLVGPAFTPWTRTVYAAYSLLLLEPAVRGLRRGRLA